jgi:hypothetical protein
MGQALQPVISVVSRDDCSCSDLARPQTPNFDFGVGRRSPDAKKLAELINSESLSPNRNSLRLQVRNFLLLIIRFRNIVDMANSTSMSGAVLKSAKWLLAQAGKASHPPVKDRRSVAPASRHENRRVA